jgi:hypothetical protein
LKELFLAAAMLIVSSGVSLAESFTISVVNRSAASVTGISVRDSQVSGDKQIASNDTKPLTVKLADGACQADVSFSFADETDLDYGPFDFCTTDTLVVAQ